MRHVLFTLLLALVLGLDTASASTPSAQHFSIDVPQGRGKTIRLQNLPKDTRISLALTSNGPLTVWFLDGEDQKLLPHIAHPLFWGQVESKLGFSVTIQQEGDYYVLLDNQDGTLTRQLR